MIRAPIFPPRLQTGDLVRVVSCGLSLRGANPAQREFCNANLAAMGLRVSFGNYVDDSNDFDTSSVAVRVADLHEALRDGEVKAILSGLGGMNTAQILRSIDWNLLRNNPKVISGFSDIATLVNAVYAKTGVVTYYGPFYGTFGMKKGAKYMLDTFQKCLFSEMPFIVQPSPHWSDDCWWLDQNKRNLIQNKGPLIINEGQAEGRLVGGHLTSISMLFGTEFSPDFTDTILMVEENGEIGPRSFDRLLQSAIHQKGFDRVRALLIGRFTSASGSGRKQLLVPAIAELQNTPLTNGYLIRTADLERTVDGKDYKLVVKRGRTRLKNDTSEPLFSEVQVEPQHQENRAVQRRTEPNQAVPTYSGKGIELLAYFHMAFFGTEALTTQPAQKHRDLADWMIASHGEALSRYIVDFAKNPLEKWRE